MTQVSFYFRECVLHILDSVTALWLIKMEAFPTPTPPARFSCHLVKMSPSPEHFQDRHSPQEALDDDAILQVSLPCNAALDSGSFHRSKNGRVGMCMFLSRLRKGL